VQYDSSLIFDSEVIPGVAYTLHKPSYGRTLDFDIKNAKFRQTSRELKKRQDALREELDYVRKQWDNEQESKLKALQHSLTEASEEDKAAIQAKIDLIENGYEYERLIDRSRIVTEDSHIKEIAEKLVAIGDNKTSFHMPKEFADGFSELGSDAEFLTASDYYPARLKWGLAKIEGIEIDGAPATADSLLQSGPPDLVREILLKIDTVSSMSSEELRNFQPRSTSQKAADGNDQSTTATNAEPQNSTLAETA
jgi:hypothetical protein